MSNEGEGEGKTMVVKNEEATSPYYLHPADGPGNLITTVQLKGENYEEWGKHVRNALRTKRKLGFIDGTIKKPTEAEKIEQWDVVNSMLVAWIMNTIEPTLRTSISMVDEARTLWEDLKLQFSAGNGARIHELKAEIACCRQQGDSVMVYYGRLKKLWDELAVYKPIRTCSCGEIAALLRQDQEDDRTHEFLMGLDNTKFGTVRSTITSIEPLPKLAQVYQRIIRDERQQTIAKNSEGRTEAMGFAAQAGAYPRNTNKEPLKCTRCGKTGHDVSNCYQALTCSHCGKTGHDVSNCYQVHGYPERSGRGGGRGGLRGSGRGGSSGRGRGSANIAQVVPPTGALAAHTTRQEGDYDRNSLPQLSDEQWSALMSLITAPRPNQNEKLNGNVELIDFIIDTGASHHMTGNIEYLSNIVDIAPCSIGLPDGDNALAHQQGDLCLGGDIWLREVLYCPKLKCSLISVAKLLSTNKGSLITFTADLCILQDHTRMMIGAGEECGGVYKFRGMFGGVAYKTSTQPCSRDLWHQRLGHPSARVLDYLSESINLVKSINNKAVCDTCFRAKQTRDVFSESDNKAVAIFDLIHCDVWGPYRTVSTSGASYFLTIVDDCSRAVWIFLMTEKREVSGILRNFMVMVERQFEKRVKMVRSDNGTEFMCMKTYFADEGIIHQTSCVGTPQQNGRVERKHRHILNVARALMFQAKFPIKFWGECVLAATHVINRTPTPLLDGKTPYEILFGKAPTYDMLRVLGCLCYAHKSNRDKDKFLERSRRCVFTGYPFGKKGWQLYDLDTGEFFVSRDVVFHEKIFPFASSETSDAPIEFTLIPTPYVDDDGAIVSSRVDDLNFIEENSGSVEAQVDSPAAYVDSPAEPAIVDNNIEPQVEENLGRGQRKRLPSTRLQDHVLYATVVKDPPHLSPASSSSNSGMVSFPLANYVTCDRFSTGHRGFLAAITVHKAPDTYAEAVRDSNWREAMGCEIDALELNDTWDLVELPPGKKTIGCRWVYTIKFLSDGEIERYKARLVALGNRQKEGLDYEETFAPVVKMTTIRIFLKIAATKNWEVHQMDVHNAFLHGDLTEEVYMSLPPGFRDSSGNKVCKLKKSLYGLKQAPRCWFAKLTAALTGYGFQQSKSDYSLFVLKRGELEVYVIVYVDDLLIGGNDSEAICKFKTYLGQCFHMKDLGALKYFLGIEVARSSEGIYLSQRKYACDVISECGLLGGRPVSTPVEQHHNLTADGDDIYDNPESYRRLVGRLVYLTISRPELSYIVHVLAQFMHKPQRKHWFGALRVVRYLKGSPGQGILLTAGDNLKISAYCDADFAACALTRRSLSGYVVMLGDSPVAWKTKKQRVVSRSSAEAEYRSMADTVSELKWERELLSCFGIVHTEPMMLYCDNQSALHIAANPVFHERTKHIEADCHYIRDAIKEGLLKTMKIHTTNQLADVLTKGLGIQQFRNLCRKLGICDLHAPT